MHFLTSGPVRSYGLRKAVVILDEIMDEARAGKKAANSTLRSIVRQMRVKPSDFHVESNLHTPLLTQSIVHWDKSRQEMRDIVMAASEQRNQEKAKVSADRKFKVDEEEMTIANKCPSEYFVVL